MLRNVFEARPEELNHYRYVVLGSSTYGQGDLQQDFLDFERGMDELDLTGIKAAVFGSGNSRYAYYAEAVDILEAKVKILNARLLLPSFRQDMMDGSPEGEDVVAWAGSSGDGLWLQIPTQGKNQANRGSGFTAEPRGAIPRCREACPPGGRAW